MGYHQELLPGVFLTALQTDKFKSDCFSINIVRPLRREEASMNALLPNVLLRGSGRFPDMKSITAWLDEHYGATVGTLIRKKGECQTTGFYCDYLSDRYIPGGFSQTEEMADFIFELLLVPYLQNRSFSDAYTVSEINNLNHVLMSRINDKNVYALSELLRRMCDGEAFSIPRLGLPETLTQITPDSLYRHYVRILQESRIELFYMGHYGAEKIAGIFQDHLRGIQNRISPAAPVTDIIRSASDVRTYTETMEISQSHLCMGFRTGITGSESLFPALAVFNTALGSSDGRLFHKVREESSLCYDVDATLEKEKGLMLITAGMSSVNLERTRKEILEQLHNMVNGGITQSELDNAKKALLSSCRSSYDSPAVLDSWYLGQAIRNQSETIADFSSKIAAVTMKDALEAGRRLSPDTIYELKGSSPEEECYDN